MVTDTERALTELAERGPEPLLRRATGSIRLDLSDGSRTQHWYLDIHQGKVELSHREAPADAVMRTSRELFDEIVQGMRNAMAATLRNEIAYEGDPSLLLLFRRLFPWPPVVTAAATGAPPGSAAPGAKRSARALAAAGAR